MFNLANEYKAPDIGSFPSSYIFYEKLEEKKNLSFLTPTVLQFKYQTLFFLLSQRRMEASFIYSLFYIYVRKSVGFHSSLVCICITHYRWNGNLETFLDFGF